MDCKCSACKAQVTLCWTRLAGGVWVLSIREQLFANPSLLCAVDSAGEALWFLDKAPVTTGGGNG